MTSQAPNLTHSMVTITLSLIACVLVCILHQTLGSCTCWEFHKYLSSFCLCPTLSYGLFAILSTSMKGKENNSD